MPKFKGTIKVDLLSLLEAAVHVTVHALRHEAAGGQSDWQLRGLQERHADHDCQAGRSAACLSCIQQRPQLEQLSIQCMQRLCKRMPSQLSA